MSERTIIPRDMMHSSVSVSTLCLSDLPLDAALSVLAGETDSVELMNDGLHAADGDDILSSYRFRYTVHAATRSVNIASVLEPVRRESSALVADSIRLAADCDAAAVVFHPGYHTFAVEHEASVAALNRSLTEIGTVSVEYGIPCRVENMGNWGYHYLQHPQELAQFETVGFCLDIGHANVCGELDGFLEKPFDHIHVHDNDGTSDTHLRLGSGTISADTVFSALSRNPSADIVAECMTLGDAVATKKCVESALRML